MNDNDLRRHVKRLYPLSKKWAERVDKMSIAQVYRIHLRQCRIQDEERKLQEKKQQMREALLDEHPAKVDLFLQTSLF